MMPDTTGVELNDFPPIKEDWYGLIFSDFEEKKDKNNNTYAKLEFTIEGTKRKAWVNLSYDIGFLWKVKQFKAAVGASDTDRNLADFKNVRLKGYVKDELYQGKHYPRVEEFKPYGSNLTEDNPESRPEEDSDDQLPF